MKTSRKAKKMTTKRNQHKRHNQQYLNDANIIFTSFKRDEVNANKIKGIRSIHQLLSLPEDGGTLYRRDTCCWCQNCIAGKFDECKGKDFLEPFIPQEVQQIPVATEGKKAVGTVESYAWNLYKHELEDTTVPIVVAVKHSTEERTVIFCHVRSKAFRAKQASVYDLKEANLQGPITKNNACITVCPLQLVPGTPIQKITFISSSKSNPLTYCKSSD